jgi:hypothetical protein
MAALLPQLRGSDTTCEQRSITASTLHDYTIRVADPRLRLHYNCRRRRVCAADAAAFTAIWVLLILVVVVVIGTVILRKYHTPLAVGVLLGLTSMVSRPPSCSCTKY